MWRVQPRRRIYNGRITLEAQPITWIRKHKTFASSDWLEGQVRYGAWERQGENGHFRIITNVNDGMRFLNIEIQIQKLRFEVVVRHCHVLRRKN